MKNAIFLWMFFISLSAVYGDGKIDHLRSTRERYHAEPSLNNLIMYMRSFPQCLSVGDNPLMDEYKNLGVSIFNRIDSSNSDDYAQIGIEWLGSYKKFVSYHVFIDDAQKIEMLVKSGRATPVAKERIKNYIDIQKGLAPKNYEGITNSVCKLKTVADRALIDYLRRTIEYHDVLGSVLVMDEAYRILTNYEFDEAFAYDQLYLLTYVDARKNGFSTEKQADLFCRLVELYPNQGEVREMAEFYYSLYLSSYKNRTDQRKDAQAVMERINNAIARAGMAK